MNMFEETLYGDHGQTLAMDTVLHRGRTEHQDVIVFANRTFGRVLALDNVVQFTERDNHIYHEMIAHVPLMAHSAPRDVLIIGGGDGGTLKEVLKHPIESAVLVELDATVIALSQKYFPDISNGAFRDERANVLIGNGAAYVAQTNRRFDAIIVDSTDPAGPGGSLFSGEFYQHCRSILRPGGIISVQSGAPFYRVRQLDQALARLTKRFGTASAFLAPVPTYAHGLLALIVASHAKTFCPPLTVLHTRFARLNDDTRYYSPEVHLAAFVLPPSFEELCGYSEDAQPCELPEWITKAPNSTQDRNRPSFERLGQTTRKPKVIR